ncbi:MAG: HAD family hydrolase [Pseudomonadota bacterium]|nr:HAD family hydrolase [Pseudomonadota bacterium]MEE3071547.1 HAD family hydrolase [Pseudomonadota bacterium]
MRLAMWSGPRNLSTAMMYSFGNRSDFSAVDEPFYAAYLAMTGKVHPMGDQIKASQNQDPHAVIDQLLAPTKTPHVYHKHMTQHMIDGIPRGFLKDCTNVFLIRHPARVVASFSAKYDQPELAEIGFLQQAELYDQVISEGLPAVVVDSADIRVNPEGMLRALCAAIDLPFDPAMLAWPAGGHPDDGVWAAHWYGSVHNSKGFAGPEGPMPEVAPELAHLVSDAMSAYEKMKAVALGIR